MRENKWQIYTTFNSLNLTLLFVRYYQCMRFSSIYYCDTLLRHQLSPSLKSSNKSVRISKVQNLSNFGAEMTLRLIKIALRYLDRCDSPEGLVSDVQAVLEPQLSYDDQKVKRIQNIECSMFEYIIELFFWKNSRSSRKHEKTF